MTGIQMVWGLCSGLACEHIVPLKVEHISTTDGVGTLYEDDLPASGCPMSQLVPPTSAEVDCEGATISLVITHDIHQCVRLRSLPGLSGLDAHRFPSFLGRPTGRPTVPALDPFFDPFGWLCLHFSVGSS